MGCSASVWVRAKFPQTEKLGVWQVLLQDVGVHGRDDDVVAAVDHQRRLLEFLEVVEAAGRGGSPLAGGR